MIFWLVATAMALAALAFVLPPLFKKEKDTGPASRDLNITIHRQRLAELDADRKNDALTQEQFDKARIEIERELLQDVSETEDTPENANLTKSRWPVAVVGLVVPMLALGLYLQLGSISAVTSQPPGATNQATDGAGETLTIEEMVERLAARLATDPQDGRGWFMLGRSYLVLKRYGEAVLAYAKAHERLGDDPDLLVEYAEALALSNNNQLTGRPTELVQKALNQQPNHPKALWAAGHVALQQGDGAKAIDYWRRLLAGLPPDGKDARTVQEFIARVQEADANAGGPSASAPDQITTGAAAAVVQVRVQLKGELVAQVASTDTVFIFARAVQGPKMPLAIVRKQVKDLPVTVTLDDSMAMMPALKLSNFPQVIIGARVSKSGDATPQSGDLEGYSVATPINAKKPVVVTISKRVP
jgi:cytochrome c-type biogenesis protein CcmH